MESGAEPGARELRLATLQGLSNPMIFHVGQLPEYLKKVPQPDQILARKGGPRDGSEPRDVAPVNMPVTLPAVINGQIFPGEVDRYRFQALKGQKLLFEVKARDLIPYLADAVPGWFQATLSLRDGKGRELAYDDDYRFHPDPVLFFTVPHDGEYAIFIRDSIYRGRDDFVYRITAGELPFVTSIFPLGGPVGEKTMVEPKGWNLTTNQIVVNPREPGNQLIRVTNSECSADPSVSNRLEYRSNLVPFSADTLPECVEREPNNSPETAQSITLPIIVNGRIDHAGDADMFRFQGHAGNPVVAEVRARRLDSPLDSTLRLTDSQGRELAFNDDHEDKGSGLHTHHADSYLTATLPADGAYFWSCAMPSTRAVLSMAIGFVSAALNQISPCESCPPASPCGPARLSPSPSTPCARTDSPTRFA